MKEAGIRVLNGKYILLQSPRFRACGCTDSGADGQKPLPHKCKRPSSRNENEMRRVQAVLNTEFGRGQADGDPRFDTVWAIKAADMLAGLFGDTQPLDEAAAAEVVSVLADLHPKAFGEYSGNPERFVAAWNLERELFCLPGAPLIMEESVYKAWTTDPSHPLNRVTGLSRGEPAVHMEEVLRSCGLDPDALETRAPDHLAVLLEFVAFLLESRPAEDARRFCADHLDWLGDLKTAAVTLGGGALTTAAFEATEHLVNVVSS